MPFADSSKRHKWHNWHSRQAKEGIMLKKIYEKAQLVFGCGNPLFGDDGFGAEVVRFLESVYWIPEDAAVLDVGTAVREILFDLILSGQHPDRIVIVDAMTIEGATPGDISEIGLEDIQPAKIVDFSLHQFPTTNLLKELRNHTNIDVRVLVVEPDRIPDKVQPGLTETVHKAIFPMCERIMSILNKTEAQSKLEGEQNFEFRVGVLAEGLGVHRNTVTNWIKAGKIRARPTVGKKYHINEKDLKQFCRDSGVEEKTLLRLL
jgi:coenzyme F420 hydrogenase subunit delta